MALNGLNTSLNNSINFEPPTILILRGRLIDANSELLHSLALYLAGCKNLTCLDIAHNLLDDNALNIIKEALKNVTSLETLRLEGNEFTSLNRNMLINQVLQTNPYLTTLSLDGNGDQNDDEEAYGSETTAIEMICSILEKGYPLVEIGLPNNDISNEELKRLCVGFEASSTLAKIDLSTNSFGNTGAQHLIALLTKNHNITSLNIEECIAENGGFIDEDHLRNIDNLLIKNSQIVAAKNSDLPCKALALINRKQGPDSMPTLFQIAGVFVNKHADPELIAMLCEDVKENLMALPEI